MNTRAVTIFAIVVAVIVGSAIYFLNSPDAPHASPVAIQKTSIQQNQTNVVVNNVNQNVAINPPPLPSVKPPAEPPKPKITAPPTVVTMTEDDRKIDTALNAFPGNTDADHANTAQLLINMLPTLGKEGQVEAAQHVSNLLSDEEYKRVMHIWRNPTFNPDVLEVLHTDLMNREHSLLLPALLDAVKMPNHPSHEEAKSTLQVFLDEDYGDDVAKWDAATKAYLKKEAEEEAAALAPQPPSLTPVK